MGVCMTWTLLARDADRHVVGVLQGWSIRATLRHNAVGTVTIDLPRDRTPTDWPHPLAGYVLLRDNKVVASGCFDEDAFEWSADPNDGAAGQGIFSLTGDTDLGRLAYRHVYPDPAQAWKDQTANTHFTYPAAGAPAEAAELVLRELVDKQAGPGARPGRREPGLILSPTTGPYGTPTRVSERFTGLLDAMRKVALNGGGLAFDVLDNLSRDLIFRVSETRDLSEAIHFGRELGNVLRLSVRRVSPIATAVLIAAQGEGTARRMAEYAWPSDYGRREMFLDQRQVDDALTDDEQKAEYEKAANEAYAANGEQTAVHAEIMDTPAVQWGRDFSLGDKVSVHTPFGPVTDLVRQIEISVDATGVENVTSIIGSTDPLTDDPLVTQFRRIAARVSQLERGR